MTKKTLANEVELGDGLTSSKTEIIVPIIISIR